VTHAPIAVVGRACLLPGIDGPKALWDAVLTGKDLISSVPEGRWRLSKGRAVAVKGAGTADRALHDRGGYVVQEVLTPEGAGLDRQVSWLFHTARQALAEVSSQKFGRRGAVVGNLSFPTSTMAALYEAPVLGLKSPDARNRFMSGLPALLLEQHLGLEAGAFALDAACASSLYAIKRAADLLAEGRADLMLAGAVNCPDDLFIHVGFTALSALSKTGRSRPFDAGADGLVPAEGAAFVALKRLDDARRDGDRIYGVIRGVGLSNDGRGKGFLVPSESGQARAMRQAFDGSGVAPSDISLLECHATGTPVGDATELGSTSAVYAGHSGLAIGSLKSNLGHLVTAAGVAGLLKVLQAMEAGVRPPTLHVERPTKALEGTPLRPLLKAEPWDVGGKTRRAAVSAFGFGGNNAHLLVEAHDSTTPAQSVKRFSHRIAITGVGVKAGAAADLPSFEAALFSTTAPTPVAQTVEVQQAGLRTPPADLKQTLPQQLMMLGAAQDAVKDRGAALSTNSAVVVGMGTDVEVARYGLRWRLAESRLADAAGEAWISTARDAVQPVLESAGVIGTMPNMVANRLSVHFGLEGPGFTVSAEERSGLEALDFAVTALSRGEVDAALVGAVDLAASAAHVAAAKQTLKVEHHVGGDAAVALVLERLDDATAAGRRIYAVLGDDAGPKVLREASIEDLSARFGHTHAASGLLSVAAGALTLARQKTANGTPSLEGPSRVQVTVTPMAGKPGTVHLDAGPAPFGAEPRSFLSTFAANDLKGLKAALENDVRGDAGSCRAAVVAATPEERRQKATQLAARLETGASWTGARFARAPLGGEVAFVYAAAGAAYVGMGRALLNEWPGVLSGLSMRFKALPLALQWSFDSSGHAPNPLQKLFGTAALAQLHFEFATRTLGLTPQAAIGYSSGESAGLFSLGVWRDLDAMYVDAKASRLFEAVPGWATWAVRASPDVVRAALKNEPRAFLSIIHSDHDCVISGESAACDRVVATLGPDRARRVDYDLKVHVPDAEHDVPRWRSVHDRETFPTPVRLYSNARHDSYSPSREACRDAVTSQAVHHLDLRPTIRKAWQDGVRTFVELGPRGAVSGWVREILGDVPFVAVALDDEGGGHARWLDAVAQLWVHGVAVDAARFAAPERTPGATSSFPAHRAPPVVPPVPLMTTPALKPVEPSSTSFTTMPRAPELPRLLSVDAFQPGVPVSRPAPALVHEVVEPVRPQPVQTEYVVKTTETNTTSVGRSVSVQTMLADAHRAFLESQTDAHRAFLEQRQRLAAMMQGQANGHHPVEAPPAVFAPVQAAPVVAPPAPVPRLVAPVVTRPAAQEVVQPAAPKKQPSITVPGPKKPVAPPTGLTFDRKALEVHAGGRISEIFGPQFAPQDGFSRQVRMPEPPLLLADRVTRLDAEPATMGKGTIVTQTDVTWNHLAVHEGRMMPGLMIESGQADLMLISYLGVDLLNKGERVYRLLGCDLTYHGEAPKPGETLEYEIHVDGHAKHDDVRLFFFHYDCTVNGELRLSVRNGQAGFFTDQELANSAGILWTPETQEVVPSPRLDGPAIPDAPTSYDDAAVRAFAEGRGADCFGKGFEYLRTHVRTPRIPTKDLQLFDRVTRLEGRGGPWKRGYLSAELDLSSDDWFFSGHFKGDPCMPGTLMFDGCIQALSFYLASQGFTAKRDGHRFQVVQGEAVPLRCRGQVTPTSKKLTYEIFVEELQAGPEPTLWADVLCTVDGRKAFHARRLGVRLVPDWPITSRPELLAKHVDTLPVAKAGDFTFGYASLLACAWGKPSDAFGEMYKVFDGTRRVARLPGPPYHFMSRVSTLSGPIGVMKAGAKVDIAYDIPDDAWYFDANGARVMPFAVLLEAALQPCGWLASYVGSALTVEEDLSFRNLDGTGTLWVDVLPAQGTLSTRVELKSVSKNGGTIIESFAVECFIGDVKVYTLNTVFGFFPQAALENQVGLPTTAVDREALTAPNDFHVDLTARPAKYTQGSARLADERLLMIDRVTAYWPDGGAAGKGRLRAEKDVDPDEWFFKAHFFQDPVQPGSLGLEAMVQLLQFFMLYTGLDAGIENAHFESIETGRPLSWKYRGQVVPKNKVISTTMDIVEVGRDARGPFAVATASLWVDGKRIYEAKNLGMRIVSGPAQPPKKREGWSIDPTKESWPRDHRPTFTVPALPMTGVVDALVRGAEPERFKGALKVEDVRLKQWVALERPLTLTTSRDGDLVSLLREGQVLATGKVTADPGPRPAALKVLDAPEQPSPYDSGALFHGPAFQRLKTLRRSAEGASATLDASGPLPGALHWVLLDAATHPIDHEDGDLVYYPASVRRLSQFEPLPTEGLVRCEVRSSSPATAMKRHLIQLIRDERVLVELDLLEAGFPKGRLGQHEPALRRAFLEGAHGTGVSMSRTDGDVTRLTHAEVQAHDWLPGTVHQVYGSTDAKVIALKEHWARHAGVHPRHLPQALPLSVLQTRQTNGPEFSVSSQGAPTIDVSSVRAFWREWFGRGPWPVEDLFYGLIERLIEKVVLVEPEAFAAVKGKPVLYLANHQVAIESLLFSVIASAVQGRATLTLAKQEHQGTWVGELIRRSFSYPDIRDPGVIEFFDRSDPASLQEVLLGLRDRLAERSVMVHIEGTRSLSCREPVRKMSGAFIDLALATNVPIVPVRFVGALPVAPLETRLEVPLGHARQSIWFGAPLMPADLAPFPYGERKAKVIAAINGLGPSNAVEQPAPANGALVERVKQVKAQLKTDDERALLASVLLDGPPSSDESVRLAKALRGEPGTGTTREDEWVRGFANWLRDE